jgi:hypothetical protein
LVEHAPEKRGVTGSTPVPTTRLPSVHGAVGQRRPYGPIVALDDQLLATRKGVVVRSPNGGKTWKEVELPDRPEAPDFRSLSNQAGTVVFAASTSLQAAWSELDGSLRATIGYSGLVDPALDERPTLVGSANGGATWATQRRYGRW